MMKNMYFLLYVGLPRLLTFMPIAMWVEALSSFRYGSLLFWYFCVWSGCLTSPTLSSRTASSHVFRGTEGRGQIETKQERKKYLYIFNIVVLITSIIIAAVAIWEDRPAQDLYQEKVVGVLCAMVCVVMGPLLEREDRKKWTHHLHRWHRECKAEPFLHQRWPVLVGTWLFGGLLYGLSIFMVDRYAVEWWAGLGFLISYGVLIGLVLMMGRGLPSSHPLSFVHWYRSLLVIMAVMVPFHGFMNLIYLPMVQPWLQKSIPLWTEGGLFRIHDFIIFSIAVILIARFVFLGPGVRCVKKVA